jgi:dCTP diphosphatase
MDLKKINQKIKNFVKERDWDQFHSPKNLSMALSVEASELVEIFQWLKESDLKKVEKEKVADEIADILFYLLRISQKMNIDIEKSFYAKLKKNIIKYPVSLSKGNSQKKNETNCKNINYHSFISK